MLQMCTLQSTLRLSLLIPQGWLDRIASTAQQIFVSEQSIADQMVQCVQNLLPNWAEEDLLVLAVFRLRYEETKSQMLNLCWVNFDFRTDSFIRN